MLSSNIFGSQMGFFQAEEKIFFKIINFVDLIVNIVDGHRLQLLILLRRIGNGLFKSQIHLYLLQKKSYSSFPAGTLFCHATLFLSCDPFFVARHFF